MKRISNPRILVGLAALLLLPVFVAPLWSIRLVAPQYPDGLGMTIGVTEIRGHDRHDLQNINILNHYIGMKPIVPEEVPELEIMPIILGALVVTGLVAALIGHPWVMATWLVAFVGLGAAGMIDFYLWKVDYGTNLSPDAPIKVPGMTYQPPLIGTKQLLNITASSYPSWGTLFLGLAAISGGLGVVGSFRRRWNAARGAAAAADDAAEAPRDDAGDAAGDASIAKGAPGPGGAARRAAGRKRAARLATGSASVVLLLVLAACGPPDGGAAGAPEREPRTPENSIVYGEDRDPFCGEEVNRVRWGGELRTTAGERVRFRSVECLAGFLLAGRIEPAAVDRIRVVDFADGWRLVDVRDAMFLRSPNLSSPDGLNLHALASPWMAGRLQEVYTGPLLGWDEVLELVEREWPRRDEAAERPATGAPAPDRSPAVAASPAGS